jgi:hypothetical protein
VRAPSKKTSQNSAVPVRFLIGRTVMPGCRIGTSRYDRPAWRFSAGSVRASTKHQSELCACEVQIFWPSIRHSPSTSVARVAMAARSLPAPGSE